MPKGRFITVCLIAGLLLALPLYAARHNTQVAGWYRYALGDVLVTALQDGTVDLPTNGLHGLPADEIEALAAQGFVGDGKNMLTSFNSYLVDTGTHRILVDAGNADCYGWKLGGLAANLQAAGYAPEDIDIIVLTHLHGDHVCGLEHQGKRVFPKAVVWAAQEEAAYWLDAKIEAAAPPMARSNFAQVRKATAVYGKDFRTFKAGNMIVPGMTIVPVHGHTPGQTAFLFESKGRKLLIWGDIVHCHLVQFAHPEVSIGSDNDPAEAIATRKALFAKLAEDGTAIAGAHLPFPGIGKVRKNGNGYAFAPVEFAPHP